MADSDKTVAYGVSADASGFEKGMQTAADSARNAAGQIDTHFKKVGDAFAGVQKQLLLLAGIVAGGAFFKEAINASNQLTGETLKLSRSLGITGTEAATLRTALDDIGSNGDDYVAVFTKFARQLKSNEDGLKTLGLQTRDSNGNLRDSNELFQEAVRSVGTYKSGLDQNTYAQTVFGKSIDEVMKLQKLNNGVLEDAKRKNEELGFTISQEGVQASKEYKLAMNDVGDVLLAVKNAIGSAVMPVFTDLGRYFAETGPYVLDIFKGALTGLMLVFRTVQAAVKSFAAVIFEAINSLIDQLGNLSTLLGAVFRGDFDGAAKAFAAMGDRYVQSWRNVAGEVKTAFTDAQDGFTGDMQRVWGKGTAVGAPKGGSKRMDDFKDTNGDADKSRNSAWEAELAEQKLAFQERMNLEGSFAQFGKQAELKFWQDKLAITVAGSAENIAVRRKLADLQLAIGQEAFQHELASLQTQEAAYKNNTSVKLGLLDQEAALVKQRYGAESKEFEEVQKKIVETKRQAVEQQKQIDMERTQGARNAALAELEARRQGASLELELGTITQQDLLTRQRAFENEKNAIQFEALKERERIALADPDRNLVELERIHQEMEQAERQHQLRLNDIRNESVRESQKYTLDAVNAMGSGFQRVFQQAMQGSLSLRGIMQGLWQSMTQAVTGALAKIAAEWVLMQIKTMIFGKMMALSSITEKAGEAGAGGVASMAAAPFPLNLSAPAFGAAMSAAAMAFAPMASAAGGYDIPGTINPITQLHANEMVLPAKHADVIRSMADQGQGGGGEGGMQLHVHATDAQSVARLFRDNGDAIVSVLKSRKRDFAFRG